MPQQCSGDLYMGQVMKLWLSCYLILLSIDSKNQVTRQPQFRDLTHIMILIEKRGIFNWICDGKIIKEMGCFSSLQNMH